MTPHVAAADVVVALVVVVDAAFVVVVDVVLVAAENAVSSRVQQRADWIKRTSHDGLTCDLARRANGVLVRPVRPVEFGDGLDGPSRGDSVRPGVHEGVDGVVAEFVLEDDEASRLRA